MTDQQIVRELAKQYMELACSEKQQKRNARFLATNDLKIVRPPVLMDEIPWHEMEIDGELTCLCQEERARNVEKMLRTALYRWKYFRCDALMEPFFRLHSVLESTGNGLQNKETILRKDDKNHIVSHHYEDVLEDEEALEQMFRLPEFTLRPDKDEENLTYYTDLLGDAMPIQQCGVAPMISTWGAAYLYFMPWDIIAGLRGMEPILFDLYDRPEYMHRIMDCLCKTVMHHLDFLEAHAAPIHPTPINLHCTPGAVSGLAESGLKATWFRGAAQGFGSVSPEMHEEFEIEHILPIAQRFAYTYYGCCEPLDKKMGILRRIPNLRKVGVSPWANVDVMAEQIRGNYVYSRKPNPAHVAISTDPEVIRKEAEATVKACIRHGCPMDYTLKDISTVSYRPQNLILWADTVSKVMDEYYGEE